MHNTPYPYTRVNPRLYYFISKGKRNIEKAVEFLPMLGKNVYNLGFGDVIPGGGIDDIANSNNGDIIKIFVTIIDIVQDFVKDNPSAIIGFSGNTLNRTALYNRIIRTYYQLFSEKFEIWGSIEAGTKETTIKFDPNNSYSYSVFYIKRIK